MNRRNYLALTMGSPIFLVVLWWGATSFGFIKSIYLPPPQIIFENFLNLLSTGYSGISLASHVDASLRRILFGFFIGSAIGTFLGILRGRFASIDAIFLIPSEMFRPVPPLALVPLFILWFGIGEKSKDLLILFPVLLITMVTAEDAVRSIQTDLIRAAQTLGANKVQILRLIILPAALPRIMTGLRVAMGNAWSILIAAEMLGGDKGLGFIILDASNFFRTAYVISGIIIIGILGFLSDRTILFVKSRFIHW